MAGEMIRKYEYEQMFCFRNFNFFYFFAISQQDFFTE